MIGPQKLSKEFYKIFPTKGEKYYHVSWDFSYISLDGSFSSKELRYLADKLDEFNKKINELDDRLELGN